MRIFSKRGRWALALIALAALLASSCSPRGGNVAILWTDRPEFAFYAKYFNASQDRYVIEVFHHDFPAQRLAELGSGRDARERPDIVVASWLQGASARGFFAPLDAYISGDDPIEYAFYPRLLAKGNFDGRQYLLPVSFNAPFAVFARNPAAGGSPEFASPFTVGLDEMREMGGNFNARTGAAVTRMGFSPTWNDEFLFLAATLFDASFREAESSPLAWNPAAVEQAAEFAREWNAGVNFGAQATDNFTFRFFTIPPAHMILSGRILFAYMDSASFFTLAEDQRNDLDFRWIAEGDSIPLAAGATYLGLARRSGAPGAADAFIRWFFRADTQRALLERSHKFRQMETSFGIAGGFSALRPVTEQVFPQFYPALLGHIPPEDFLSPANVLPSDWPAIKERVVLPYLRERAAQPDAAGLAPLETRLADWARLNRF